MIAYATFAHHDAALVQAVSTKVLHIPSVFGPQAIANLLWALALLDSLSPPVWNCLLVAFVQADRFTSELSTLCLLTPEGVITCHACVLNHAATKQIDLIAARCC